MDLRGGTYYTRPHKRPFKAGYDRSSGYYGRMGTNAKVGQQGSELKFYDRSINTAIPVNGAIIDTLNNMAQDTSENGRIGRKVSVKHVYMRGTVFLGPEENAANIPQDDSVRIIVYMDKQCNGSDAIVGDILQDLDFFGYRNLANLSRFKILKDVKYDLNYGGLTSDGAANFSTTGVAKTFQFAFHTNDPIEYSGVGQSISEIRSNNFGMLFISRTGLAAVSGTSRLRYSG